MPAFKRKKPVEDFKTVKIKVGRRLPKNTNLTKPNFKAKNVVLKPQISFGEESVDDYHAIKDSLKLLDHTKQSQRTIATRRLSKLLFQRKLDLEPLLDKLLFVVLEYHNDSNENVRRLMCGIFERLYELPDSYIANNEALIRAKILCGLSSIGGLAKDKSLQFLMLIIEKDPLFFVKRSSLMDFLTDIIPLTYSCPAFTTCYLRIFSAFSQYSHDLSFGDYSKITNYSEIIKTLCHILLRDVDFNPMSGEDEFPSTENSRDRSSLIKTGLYTILYFVKILGQLKSVSYVKDIGSIFYEEMICKLEKFWPSKEVDVVESELRSELNAVYLNIFSTLVRFYSPKFLRNKYKGVLKFCVNEVKRSLGATSAHFYAVSFVAFFESAEGYFSHDLINRTFGILVPQFTGLHPSKESLSSKLVLLNGAVCCFRSQSVNTSSLSVFVSHLVKLFTNVLGDLSIILPDENIYKEVVQTAIKLLTLLGGIPSVSEHICTILLDSLSQSCIMMKFIFGVYENLKGLYQKASEASKLNLFKSFIGFIFTGNDIDESLLSCSIKNSVKILMELDNSELLSSLFLTVSMGHNSAEIDLLDEHMRSNRGQSGRLLTMELYKSIPGMEILSDSVIARRELIFCLMLKELEETKFLSDHLSVITDRLLSSVEDYFTLQSILLLMISLVEFGQGDKRDILRLYVQFLTDFSTVEYVDSSNKLLFTVLERSSSILLLDSTHAYIDDSAISEAFHYVGESLTIQKFYYLLENLRETSKRGKLRQCIVDCLCAFFGKINSEDDLHHQLKGMLEELQTIAL